VAILDALDRGAVDPESSTVGRPDPVSPVVSRPCAGRGGALAGRDAELSRLLSEFRDAADSRSFRLAVVRGPAGVGRTALLRTFQARLDADGRAVLEGAAPRPLSPAFALFSGPVSAALARLRPTVPASELSAIEQRLAPLRGGAPGRDSTPEELRAAVLALLSRVACDEPIAVLLDDADAADPASRQLLSWVVSTLVAPGASQALEHPVAGGLFVLALRDDNLPPLLENLAAAASLQVSLGALDLEGVQLWLSRARAAERLLEATGGVPGRLEDLLAPGGAVDLSARRLAQLAPADRDILTALAVVGQPADAELIAAMVHRRDTAARLASLATARQAHAEPGARRTLFSPARDADRHALLELLDPASRRALQAAAAEALASRGEVESAFSLFAEAGRTSQALATGLDAAAKLADRLALESAESVLLRLSAFELPGADRARVCLALADVQERRGDVRGALASLGRARPQLAVAERRPVRARCARLCIVLGAPAAAERLARRVIAGAVDGADTAACEALGALAEARFLRGAYAEALEIAKDSADLPAPLRRALGNLRGKALLTLGRLDEAEATFRANAVEAGAAGDDVERSRALLNVGVVAHRRGDRRAALSAYREALAAGDGPFAALARANLSSLLLEDGEADEALAQAHRALGAFARLGRRKEQAHAALNLTRVHLHLGDLDRADEVARHAAHLAERVGDPYLAAGASLVSAEVALARGDFSAAPFEAAAAAFESIRSPRYRVESLLLAAEARLASHDAAGAGRDLDRAREAGADASAASRAEHRLLVAERALLLDDADAAAAALAQAREALLAEPHVERPARLYHLLGAVAEKHGDAARAEVERLKAARIVDELAARIAPERRPLFYARRHRRAILDAAGRALLEVRRPAPAPSPARTDSSPIVGDSAAMQRLAALIARVGPSSATVLVRGESGTGKELVARALHEASPRRAMPLVTVNCGALGEELLLSELFGHEKGAFTGAIRERKGRFEVADGGTLFLDEIGDISPRAQVALLRVLQERTFERVGGSRTLKVDVRVVCATNRDLEDLKARGLFREDLYYRLRGATLSLPPLRDRIEDLPLLCAHVLHRLAGEHGVPELRLSAPALEVLARYRWPGNVRELWNVLESAAMLARGETLGPEAFELYPELSASPAPAMIEMRADPGDSDKKAPPFVPGDEPAAPSGSRVEGPGAAVAPDWYSLVRSRDISLRDLRREVDVACIAAALDEGGGNISEAARLLKVKRSRLSQIVNSEPELRALCRPGTDAADGGGSDEDDDG